MAYDRYDTRRNRYSDYDRDRSDRERGQDRAQDRGQDRGFFERAGDEVASWFGDEDAERRRREDERRDRMSNRDQDRGYGRDWNRDRYENRGQGQGRNRGRIRNDELERGFWPEHGYLRSEYDPNYEDRAGYRPMNWTSSDRDYRTGYKGSGSYGGYDRGYDYGDRYYGEDVYGTGWNYGNNYRPGGYGYDYGSGTDIGYSTGPSIRSDYDYTRSERRGSDRSDDYRRTTYAGDRHRDRHYNAWRQRHLDELDRDYDQYRWENQQRFENDFGTWRGNRLGQRDKLSKIQEHMKVVGSDGDEIGKVDFVSGDRVILTKSDSPDDRHHSIDCSMIDTVEGDEVRLNVTADEAKKRWRDVDENQALFAKNEQQGRTSLNRSFSGTYR